MCIVIIIIIIIICSYSYMMHIWSQIVAFYFLLFINVWISVTMILFHNIECGSKGNKELIIIIIIKSLSGSDCIGEAYGAVMWWKNDSKNRRLERWTNKFSFRLILHWLSLWGCHVMKEWLEKPEDSKQVNYLTNSSTKPVGCCPCATERITHRDDSSSLSQN